MRLADESTIANVEMAKAWDGHEGDLWTEHADRYDATGVHVWRAFVDRHPIGDGDRVLDVGCGSGEATRDAARLTPSGHVLGVDLSARMLDLARQRSAEDGLTNVDYERADAQVHGFEQGRFDIAISSFGGMFFADPVAAFENVGRALRPGGRLAMLAWRELAQNEWITMLRHALAVGRQLGEPPISAPGPFGLADPDHVRRVLRSAGFDAIQLDPVDEPVYLGADADDAFSFVGTLGMVEGLTQDLDENDRNQALESVYRALAAHQTDNGVLVGSAAWMITASHP